MSDSNTPTPARGGVGFMSALFLLFLGLKLTGYVTWPWWLVTAPLWAPWGVVLVVIAAFLIVGAAKAWRP